MSGGITRVWLDGVRDFLPLRKATFDFELAPLPRSLKLSAAESQLNQVPRGLARLPRVADHSSNPAAPNWRTLQARQAILDTARRRSHVLAGEVSRREWVTYLKVSTVEYRQESDKLAQFLG